MVFTINILENVLLSTNNFRICITIKSICSFRTMALIIIFNIVLGNVNVPLPSWSRENGFGTVRYPIFKFFAVGKIRSYETEKFQMESTSDLPHFQ